MLFIESDLNKFWATISWTACKNIVRTFLAIYGITIFTVTISMTSHGVLLSFNETCSWKSKQSLQCVGIHPSLMLCVGSLTVMEKLKYS